MKKMAFWSLFGLVLWCWLLMVFLFGADSKSGLGADF